MDIFKYPDPVLAKVAKEVEKVSDIEALIRPMFELMYQSLGVGLAAPQVGLSKRFFVYNPSWDRHPGGDEIVVINPQILEYTGQKLTDVEGCLSVPELQAMIVRYSEIEVAYTTIEDNRVQVHLSGLPARIFQHEFDHLDGRLLIDRMDPLERQANVHLLKKLEGRFA